MHFAFSAEQEALRRGARQFLNAHASPERVRAAMKLPAGFDPELWLRLAQELGWTALSIPEAYGGAGGTYVDLVAVMEELGRALVCGPFFSTICLATNALLTGGTEAQKQLYLPPIALGDLLATVAWTEKNGRFEASGIEATARPDGDGFVLNGTKAYVVDGHVAGLIIVAARTMGSAGEDGVSLFAVSENAAGLERVSLTTMDQTRRLADVVLHDVRVPRSAIVGEPGGGWPILSRTLDLAAVALAAEQVGGAQRCLDMAVDYAKVRVQFNRPIGSFQAIKHKCADMMVLVESARSAAYYAAWAAADAPDELPVAASLARAYCSDAYFQCAAENIQVHGGIGFTWEHDAHLYFKRAKSSETLLGDPSFHRELVARRVGL